MKVSNCCNASVSYVEEDGNAICNDCKEHCEWVEENESEFCNGKMD